MHMKHLQEATGKHVGFCRKGHRQHPTWPVLVVGRVLQLHQQAESADTTNRNTPNDSSPNSGMSHTRHMRTHTHAPQSAADHTELMQLF